MMLNVALIVFAIAAVSGQVTRGREITESAVVPQVPNRPAQNVFSNNRRSHYSASNLADQCQALREAADTLCGNVVAHCPIPPKNCTERLHFDFLYIIDESGSIESFNQNGFAKEKQFLTEFTNQYTIGPNPEDSRAGLIAFGTVANVEFLPGQYQSNDNVIQAIQQVKFSSGNTNIRDALQQAADVATLPDVRRPDVPLAVILLTDGKSNIGSAAQLSEAAATLRSLEGVEVFAIGIKTLSDDGESQPTYDKRELLNIVGNDSSHFFETESFDALALSGDLVARDVCECVSTGGRSSTAMPATTSIPSTVTLSTLLSNKTSPTTVVTIASTNATTSSEATTTSEAQTTSQTQEQTTSSFQTTSTPAQTTEAVTTAAEATTQAPPTIIVATQEPDVARSTETPAEQTTEQVIIVTEQPSGFTLGE